MTVAGTMIRGTALAPSKQFVMTRFGQERWDDFLEPLSEQTRDVFAAPILPVSWYPFTAALEMIDSALRLAGGDVGVLREIAFFNLDYATNLVFKAIFKLGSPELMVGKSDQVWKKYYSRGHMVPHVTRRNARIELFDFPELTRVYGLVVLHSIEAVVVKAGGNVVRAVQTRDLARGDAVGEFVYEWR